MSDFNFEETLKQKLDCKRDVGISKLTEEETVKVLNSVSPDSVKKRFENKILQKLYKMRNKLMKKLIDLHIHTVCSDETLTPKEIIDEAVANKVSTITICDHDTIDAYNEELFEYARKRILI